MKTVWAFDLGKGSIGEAVRRGNEFLHKASLLIPAEFAETKTAAGRRRMMRTRDAHKEREIWLEKIWDAAPGLAEFRPKKRRWVKQRKCFDPVDTDYRLKREFAPAEFRRDSKTGERKKVEYPNGRANIDGAPAATREDFETCYTSCLLRIKLLRGDSGLKEWQIYKALHAAIQKRGYERVPWAAKEAARQGLTPKEVEEKEHEELLKKELKYQETVTAWGKFLHEVLDTHSLSHEQFAFPCYYDAYQMGLWNPEQPLEILQLGHKHGAESTRNIRFDRKDLEREITMLVENADKLLNGKLEQCRLVLLEKFKQEKFDRVNVLNSRLDRKNKTLPVEKQKQLLEPPKLENLASSASEFFLYGPAGKPPDETKNDFAKYLTFRRQAGLRPGTKDDWMGALGQKIPRFDNRIVEQCALIPRLNVCKATAKPGKAKSAPDPESLLHCEVAFLMKLKNIRVMPNVRPLTARQIAMLLEEKRAYIAKLALDPANSSHAKKIAKCYSFSAAQWKKLGKQAAFNFEPHAEHTKIEPSLPLPSTLEGFADAFEKQLHKVRVLRAESVEALTAPQVEKILAAKRKELRSMCFDSADPKYAEIVAKVYSYETERAWAEVGELPEFAFWPAPNHEIIEAPKSGGRSRFSRPALRLLRALVLSGEKPSRFRQLLIDRDPATLAKLEFPSDKPFALFPNCTDPKLSEQQREAQDAENGRKGLLESDLNFLLKMKKADATDDSWNDLFIPNEKLDGLVQEIQSRTDEPSLSQLRMQAAQDGCSIEAKSHCRLCASEKAIRDLIGEQNDPVVRQRLKYFWERLQTLEKEHEEPERIVLEFAREDFLGKKAKESWKKFNDRKRESNKKAAEYGGSEREQLKFKLWQDQGGECVYGIPARAGGGETAAVRRGLPLPGSDAFRDKLEIDHIVPQAQGGPDAYVNWVLTYGEIANGVKRDMTPYEWFMRDRLKEWDGYVEFVRNKKETNEKPGLSRKKIALLTRPDAKDLVQKYTALAETAWISRLAQTIIRLHFGWPLDHQKGVERVLTLTGGQTADFRRRFRLNTLLGPNAKLDESASDISKADEEKAANEIQDNLMSERSKNRVDPRHHALDAMVLTLIPEWRHYQAKKFERWRAWKSRQELRPEILERPTPFFDFHSTLDRGKLNNDTVRNSLRDALNETHAEVVAFERPKLEQTHYARKKIESETCYVKREELRLMAYDVKGKPDVEFKMEFVLDDAKLIDTERPGMAQLKSEIEHRIASNPTEGEKPFTAWLVEKCQQLPGKKIQMQPLASLHEEPDSKRRRAWKSAEDFGRRKQPMKFKYDRVVKRYRKICDKLIRDLIAKNFEIQGEGKKAKCRSFTRDEWEAFCASFHKPTKFGGQGPRVLKVTIRAGGAEEEESEDEESSNAEEINESSGVESANQSSPVLARDEYKESTKSPKAFLKGESHKGYYLYLDDKGKARRWPVYAHESFKEGHERYEEVKRQIKAEPESKFQEIGFLKTGCKVELEGATDNKVYLGKGKKMQKNVSLPKGFYRMNTLGDNLRMKLTTQNGNVAGAQVDVFIKAGLRVVKVQKDKI